MLCLRRASLNAGATPAVLHQPRRKNPSAQRFVHRPRSRHLNIGLAGRNVVSRQRKDSKPSSQRPQPSSNRGRLAEGSVPRMGLAQKLLAIIET